MLPGDGGPKYFGGSGAVLEFCVFNHPRTYNISAWFEVEIGGWVGWGGVGWEKNFDKQALAGKVASNYKA